MTEEDKVPTKVVKRGKKPAEVIDKANLSVQERLQLALSVVKAGDGGLAGIASELDLSYEKLATGFPALDTILDGGFPRGKFTLIAGPEQTCKTYLAMRWIAHQQSINPDFVAVWVDAENSFDKPWAAKAGVDLGRLAYIGPGMMENIMQDVINVAGTGVVDAIIVDSLGGLVTLAELKKKKEDKGMTRTLQDDSMASLAKKAGQFFRMANPVVAQHKPAVVLIGHVYANIGNDYQEFEVRGGNPVKYWTHLRIMSRRRKGAQDAKVAITMPSGQTKEIYAGYEAVFTVDKTRQGAHYGHEVSIPFVYGQGLSNEKSIIDMAFAYGIISVAGAWFSHPALPNGKMQGRENVETFLQEDKEAFSKILAEVGIKLAKGVE
jgi:recombination protein RecA